MLEIFITWGKRQNRPFLLSVEDKNVVIELEDGVPVQVDFQSQYDSPLVNSATALCTQETFDEIKELAGTLEAPAMLENAESEPFENRLNVYIENDTLTVLEAA